MQYYNYFLLIYLAVFSSCQDTKTNRNEAEITIVEIPDKKEKIKEIPPKKPEKITEDNVVERLTEYGKENPENKVRLKTKFGDIEIELFEETPLHRANFIQIVKKKFLNETCFYRVSKDFVIQGGNSDRKKMAKIKNSIGIFTIPPEFKSQYKHVTGAVAMARGYENNPARRSSPYEFYIVVNTSEAVHLNNEHTVFGKVTKGMDVVRKINKVEVDFSEWPKRDVYMEAEIIN